VLDDALPLWLTLLEPPEPCYPVLEALILEKRVLADAVWARIRNQFEANKTTAAAYSMNYLPPSQTPDKKLAQTIIDAPLPWLGRLPGDFSGNRMQRELAILGIQRIARNDPRMAAQQLQRIAPSLSKEEQGWAWTQIGRQAAQDHMPEAIEWYRKAGDARHFPMTRRSGRCARRCASRTGARALDDRKDAAGTGRATGLGLLAGPRLPRRRHGWPRPTRSSRRSPDSPTFTATWPATISASPLHHRRRHRRRAGKSWRRSGQARRAARAALLSPQPALGSGPGMELVAARNERPGTAGASTIALRADIYDRAIAAADRTRNEHDYSLRYLAPFGDQVRPAARNQALDDAWVYGLMRQESRFVSNARSGAGASGLMQLMPATAKWVAGKIGLKDYHQGQVNDTETNLLLGTSYMRLVLEEPRQSPGARLRRLQRRPRSGAQVACRRRRWKAPSMRKRFLSAKPGTT
jgi:soluble lytic murein transglycosylase